jgi:hypothetical protein
MLLVEKRDRTMVSSRAANGGDAEWPPMDGHPDSSTSDRELNSQRLESARPSDLHSAAAAALASPVCSTATWLLLSPFDVNPRTTCEPSSSTSRIDLFFVARFTSDFGSQRARSSVSSKAANSAASGAPTVLLRVAV